MIESMFTEENLRPRKSPLRIRWRCLFRGHQWFTGEDETASVAVRVRYCPACGEMRVDHH